VNITEDFLRILRFRRAFICVCV